MERKRKKPYIKKPKVFEIKAEDVISGAIDIDAKIQEVKEADGELRIINKDKFYENNKKNAYMMRDIIMKSADADIYISTDGVKFKEDGPFDKDRIKDLDKSQKSIKTEITDIVEKRGNREN